MYSTALPASQREAALDRDMACNCALAGVPTTAVESSRFME
jgi:hypothetical protein